MYPLAHRASIMLCGSPSGCFVIKYARDPLIHVQDHRFTSVLRRTLYLLLPFASGEEIRRFLETT